jgi:hypothetical protein
LGLIGVFLFTLLLRLTGCIDGRLIQEESGLGLLDQAGLTTV